MLSVLVALPLPRVVCAGRTGGPHATCGGLGQRTLVLSLLDLTDFELESEFKPKFFLYIYIFIYS